MPASAAQPRRRTVRRRHLSRAERSAASIVAAGVGVGAAVTTSAQPTGLAVVDPTLCLLLVMGGAIAGRRADVRTIWWLCGVAAAAAIPGGWAVAALLGAGALVIELAEHAQIPPLRIAGAAAGTATLLHLPTSLPTGLPSALAAVALLPLATSALRAARTSERRRIVRVVQGAALLLALATAGIAFAVLEARDRLNEATASVAAARRALEAGESVAAAREFRAAAALFDDARQSLDAPWTLPAAAVPIAAQHRTALRDGAAAGAALARAAAVAAADADLDQLRVEGGRVDLGALEALRSPARGAVDALERAKRITDGVDSPWLVPPVATALDSFRREVGQQLPGARRAQQAIDLAPQMLGRDRPRRYLVVFANPAETRFQGGFIGAYASVVARGGSLELEAAGHVSDLIDATGEQDRTLSMPRTYHARYDRYSPTRFFQNLTASPDFPTNAEALRQLYPQAGGEPIDGVIYADPRGLAALLALSGPVRVEGLDERLSAEVVEELLLRRQYLELGTESERNDLLEVVARTTFEALLERSLPSPGRMADELGPAVDGHHLAFVPFDEGERRLLDELDALSAFGAPEPGTDVLSIRSSNENPSKIDAFLERTVHYDVEWDPASGAVEARATVSLHNGAPDGLPRYVVGNLTGDPMGTNRSALSLYSALRPVATRLDGQAVAVSPERELGLRVTSLEVVIPRGATRVVEVALVGRVRPGRTFEMTIAQQPTALDDRMTVAVRTPDGPARRAAGRGGTWEGRLTADRTLIWEAP